MNMCALLWFVNLLVHVCMNVFAPVYLWLAGSALRQLTGLL